VHYADASKVDGVRSSNDLLQCQRKTMARTNKTANTMAPPPIRPRVELVYLDPLPGTPTAVRTVLPRRFIVAPGSPTERADAALADVEPDPWKQLDSSSKTETTLTSYAGSDVVAPSYCTANRTCLPMRANMLTSASIVNFSTL
jgi:hypothetical protein